MANIAELSVSIGADIQELKAKMAQVEKTVNNTGKSVNNLGDNFKKLGGIITGAIGVSTLIQFGKEVIAITAEFQKFEAVLTNALGSKSEAQTAMLKIQDLAAKTPFSVRQLTEAYVQLANRGIEPSTATMTKMGDVAATLGKDIGQLNEAILDVSNSERWNELGIKVTVNGNKMIGTFKGMRVEVDKTSEGALKMIERFGEMDTVAGAMAGVSATLGGKLSNLDDSFDQLYVTIGGLTSGPITWFIESVNEMVSATTRLLKSQETLRKESHLKTLGKEAEEVSQRLQQLTEDNIKLGQKAAEAQQNAYQQIKEELESVIALQKKQLDQITSKEDDLVDPSRAQLDAIAAEYQSTKELIEINEARLVALDKVITKTNEETTVTLKATEAKKEETGILNELNNQKKIEQDLMNSANNEAEIEMRLQNIAVIDKEIKRLQDLNKARGVEVNPIESKGIDSPGITPQLGIDLTPAIMQVDALTASLENVQEKASETSQFLQQAFSNAAISVAESFGQMIAGSTSVSGFFDGIIMMVVDFVSQFGKLLIAAAIASEMFQKALMSNPYMALAAGVALVAAGAAAKAFLKKGPSGGGGVREFANGGVIYGPTLGIMGEYPGARSNPEVVGKLSDIQSLMGGTDGGGKVVFEIEGTKLKGVLDKQNTRDNRIGRN